MTLRHIQAYPYANISDLITYSIEPEAAAAELPTVTDGPPAGSVIPKQYPLYKQCDSRWGSDLIYTETVCAVGCLMSSTSMALGGHDITVSGQSANPGDLNAWLKTNHGYIQNDLIESVVPVCEAWLLERLVSGTALSPAAAPFHAPHMPLPRAAHSTEGQPPACVMACRCHAHY